MHRALLLLCLIFVVAACGSAPETPSHPCGDDRDTAVLAGRGESAFGAGNFELATACYERVLELDAADLDARIRLAELEQGWGSRLAGSGDAASARGHFAAASQALEPVLAQPGAVPAARELELLELYAQVSLRGGRVEPAHTLLVARLERADTPSAQRERLVVLIDALVMAPITALPAAERDALEQRFATASSTLRPHLFFGDQTPDPVDTPEEEAKVAATLADLEALVAAQPSYWQAAWLIGKAHEAMGDSPTAVTWFARAHTANPHHPTNAHEYVLNLVFARQAERALEISKPAAERFPHDAQTLANHARVLLELCRLPEARSTAEAARAIDPKNTANNEVLRVIAEIESGQRTCP